MTSRFGKTYNRKGGEANSKFEEVFSNRRPSLTTKWGETTYKAQLGAKRPLVKPEASELSKRPRLEDSDNEDDPFGFDSDEESKTVTSHSVTQTKVKDRDVSKTTALPGSGKTTIVTAAQTTARSTVTFTSELSILGGKKNIGPRKKPCSVFEVSILVGSQHIIL